MSASNYFSVEMGKENTQPRQSRGLFSLQRSLLPTQQSWRRMPRLQRTLILLVLCVIGALVVRKLAFAKRPVVVATRTETRESPRQRAPLPDNYQLVKKVNVEEPPKAMPPPRLGSAIPSYVSNATAQQSAIIKSFLHSWKAYKKYAWGKDEVHPLTRSFSTWMGAALTMVDALDTMWLMGLKEEYKEARDWVADNLHFNLDKDHVSVFETTIRVLGGLVSIYYLTGDKMYLTKAIDLGDRLLPAFDTASGLPVSDINLARKTAQYPMWTRDSSTAEVATLSLEFLALARASGQKRFKDVIDRLTLRLHHEYKPDNLVPIYVNADSGKFRPGAVISFGARGDTYYEYLVKHWLMSNKTEDYLRQDYLASMQGMKKRLLRRSKPNNLLFIGELVGGRSFEPKMDHLVCFVPGMLAYGVLHGMPREHLQIAKQLMLTCYEMYNQMPTGLSPEIVYFNMEEGEKKDILVKPLDKHNLQRPETVESLMYMYRVTKKQKYRDWGWNIFQAFEKYTKELPYGYVSIGDVTNTENVRKRTKCESFWFAETLKYFFLLFSDDSVVDLKKFVITTEAHPIPLG